MMICSTLIDVLKWSPWSSSSFLLMMLMAGSIGTDVKSAETSYDTIAFGFQSDPFQLLNKVSSVLYVVGELPTSGLRILDNSLASS